MFVPESSSRASGTGELCSGEGEAGQMRAAGRAQEALGQDTALQGRLGKVCASSQPMLFKILTSVSKI